MTLQAPYRLTPEEHQHFRLVSRAANTGWCIGISEGLLIGLALGTIFTTLIMDCVVMVP